jgi:hydrogenase nickel incorporation protein HypA/HybF
MHEAALLRDLVRAVDATAADQRLRRVTCVRLRVGALSHLTPLALSERWPAAAAGTVAEAARVEVEVSTDLDDPRAQGVVLVAIEGVDGGSADGPPSAGGTRRTPE